MAFVPGHVSSSSILSRTKHVVILHNILLLIGIWEKCCNSETFIAFFFDQELLFGISVILEMLLVKLSIATLESLILKVEFSCKSESVFCFKGLSSCILCC